MHTYIHTCLKPLDTALYYTLCLNTDLSLHLNTQHNRIQQLALSHHTTPQQTTPHPTTRIYSSVVKLTIKTGFICVFYCFRDTVWIMVEPCDTTENIVSIAKVYAQYFISACAWADLLISVQTYFLVTRDYLCPLGSVQDGCNISPIS